ncbi:MAG: sulfatase-like hydrolase/transferase [Planctomycetota bacterium]|nr:sulfatase-like hydrolase/transferase [Planctomycetota bacterium]
MNPPLPPTEGDTLPDRNVIARLIAGSPAEGAFASPQPNAAQAGNSPQAAKTPVSAGNASASAPAARPLPRYTVFWPTFFLALVLIGAKVAYLCGQDDINLGGILRNLPILAADDLLFAIGFGFVGFALMQPPHAAWRKWSWLTWLSLCVVCVVYAVVSVQIFRFLRTPLTWSLLYLAGTPKNMESSIWPFVTPALVTGMVAAPILFCLVTWMAQRRLARRGKPMRLPQAAMLSPALVVIGYVHFAGIGAWSDRDDRRILHNPHWVWISTCATELLGGGGAHLESAFSEVHLKDFQTFAERGSPLAPNLALARRPKNVVLIVMESVGTQQMSLYGSPYKTTPNLDALAKDGIVFDNFYSHMGNSANAFVAMSLSAYPPLSWREYTRDRPDTPGVSLADVLKRHGRRTGFINLTDNGYANMGRFASHRGYDVVWDYHQLKEVEETSSWGSADRHLVDGACQFLDRFKDEPFFLMLWTQQTHHPYELSHDQKPIDFFAGKPLPIDDYNLGRYLNCLHEADAQIGRLMGELRARGIADDTMLVVIGDHGEAFGSPHNTYGHGQKLYEECVHVPCLMHFPGLPYAGMRSAVAGAQVDLNPSILDVLGLPAEPGWQGHSLFAPEPRKRSYFFAATTDYQLGLREHGWKYMVNATLAREELYNLEADPQELHNLAKEEPERCIRLKPYLAAWVAYQRDKYAAAPR